MIGTYTIIFFSIFIVILAACGQSDKLSDLSNAEKLYNDGKYNEALESIKKTISKNPSDEKALHLMGDILMDLGRQDDAVESYKQAINIKPKYNEPYYDLVKIYRKNKDYKTAIRYCDEISSKDSKQIDLKATLEKEQVMEGNLEIGPEEYDISQLYESALCLYDEAIRLNPNYTSAWNNKGVALGEIMRLNESIECFNKALNINSSFAEAWNNKGVSLGKLGKYNESIECYGRAIETNPYLAEAWYNKAKAVVDMDMSRHNEAMSYYNKSIKLKQELRDIRIQDYIYLITGLNIIYF